MEKRKARRRSAGKGAAPSNQHEGEARDAISMATDALRSSVSIGKRVANLKRGPQRDQAIDEFATTFQILGRAFERLDQEQPRYRIVERLRRAADSAAPSLSAVATLLIEPRTSDKASFKTRVKRLVNRHSIGKVLRWILYVFDQLLNSHQPPGRIPVMIDVTREEWRTAEIAFGCILFDDGAFLVMQDKIEQATCHLNDALNTGGRAPLPQSLIRVRDLLARCDARVLDWFSQDVPIIRIEKLPPSIEALRESPNLYGKLVEVYFAAKSLQIALNAWDRWFVQLQTKGDAHPGIALDCNHLASRALVALTSLRPHISPFDYASLAELIAALPPLPTWFIESSDLSALGGLAPHRAWQQDRAFLDRYYLPNDKQFFSTSKLQGAVPQLIEALETYPLSVMEPDCESDKVVPIPPNGETVLITMFELGAVDPDRRQSAQEIIEKAFGRLASANSYKQLMTALKRLMLVDTRKGPKGGCWLTTTGRLRAQRLRAGIGG
jgi:hypothetical protein